MGQFSWLYNDTGKQMIDNKYADSYLLVPLTFPISTLEPWCVKTNISAINEKEVSYEWLDIALSFDDVEGLIGMAMNA